MFWTISPKRMGLMIWLEAYFCEPTHIMCLAHCDSNMLWMDGWMYHLCKKNTNIVMFELIFWSCEPPCERNFKKISEVWKELDQTKKMRPTATFFDHSFRSYSSFKITCLKMIWQNQDLTTLFTKKRTTFKLLLRSSPWMKFKKIGEIWKDLDQMKTNHDLFRSFV